MQPCMWGNYTTLHPIKRYSLSPQFFFSNFPFRTSLFEFRRDIKILTYISILHTFNCMAVCILETHVIYPRSMCYRLYYYPLFSQVYSTLYRFKLNYVFQFNWVNFQIFYLINNHFFLEIPEINIFVVSGPPIVYI